MNLRRHRLGIAVLILVLTLLPIRSVSAKRITTHELYVEQGERFQVVCNYPDATMQYGSNGKDGVIGVCE